MHPQWERSMGHVRRGVGGGGGGGERGAKEVTTHHDIVGRKDAWSCANDMQTETGEPTGVWIDWSALLLYDTP